VHQSTGRAAHEVEKQIEEAHRQSALSYHMLSAFATVTIDKWDNFQTLNYRTATASSPATWASAKDPDTLAMRKSCTRRTAKAHRGDPRGQHHHVLIYPGLSCNRRCSSCAPCGRWASTARSPRSAFRLKGAPSRSPPLARHTTWSTRGNADQCRRPGELLEIHQGLASTAATGQLGRHHGHDIEKDGTGRDRAELRHLEAPIATRCRPGKVHARMKQQHEVEQFLYRQAELLDSKRWQAGSICSPGRRYWMPADPSHKHWTACRRSSPRTAT